MVPTCQSPLCLSRPWSSTPGGLHLHSEPICLLDRVPLGTTRKERGGERQREKESEQEIQTERMREGQTEIERTCFP